MERTKGIILGLLASASFGLIAFFSVPILNEGLTPSSILLYRSLIAIIILGAVCAFKKQSLRIPLKSVAILAILGVFYALTSYGLIYSYQYIDSGIATTIHFLFPVVVAVLMIVFFKEKINAVIFVAAFLALIGVCLLSWSGSGFIEPKGLAAVVGTIFTYAIYIVAFSRSDLKKLPQRVAMIYVLFFGIVMFFIITISTTGLQAIPSTKAVIHLLGLATIPTLISGLALIAAIRLAGSTITSILASVEPVVAMLVGTLYFNEPFGWNSLFGLAIIISSVLLVVFVSERQSKKGENKALKKS